MIVQQMSPQDYFLFKFDVKTQWKKRGNKIRMRDSFIVKYFVYNLS